MLCCLQAKAEGVLSLYRGLLSPVLGYGLIKATAFSSYAQLKALLTTHGWNAKERTSSDSLGAVCCVLCCLWGR